VNVSARKIALLALIVVFGASLETAWNLRGDVRIGPEGCRAIGGRFYGPSYAFEAAAEQAVPAGLAPRLEVDNAFGGVHVARGGPGIVKVKLRKVVFLPTQEKARAFADRIELKLAADGPLVRVSTNRDAIGRGEQTGFETHLEIEVPAETAVEVRSEHGPVELSGVAAADVTSSFEKIAVADVASDVKLEARHGEVRVERVGGHLELDSRYGDVSVADLRGTAKLDVQHGNLGTRGTAGLEIDLAHGDLTAESVSGPLVARGQHAAVRASDVSGRAEVETSFGDVRLERVGGDARLKVQHGRASADDVSGGVSAETSYEGVELLRVTGPVELRVQHGGVQAAGLAGGARITASGGDVALDGFAGPVQVEVERGNVRLAPHAVLGAELVARTTNGDLRLEVPEGSHFDLEAESRRGQVSVPREGLATREDGGEHGRGERVLGKYAGGGVPVRLNADDDVTLESRPAGPIADRSVAKPVVTTRSLPEAPAAAPSPKPAAKPSPKPAAPAEAPPVPPAPPAPPQG
jgi:DUF4097 and DUF4098 domain-containing protein YvlB